MIAVHGVCSTTALPSYMHFSGQTVTAPTEVLTLETLRCFQIIYPFYFFT